MPMVRARRDQCARFSRTFGALSSHHASYPVVPARASLHHRLPSNDPPGRDERQTWKDYFNILNSTRSVGLVKRGLWRSVSVCMVRL